MEIWTVLSCVAFRRVLPVSVGDSTRERGSVDLRFFAYIVRSGWLSELPSYCRRSKGLGFFREKKDVRSIYLHTQCSFQKCGNTPLKSRTTQQNSSTSKTFHAVASPTRHDRFRTPYLLYTTKTGFSRCLDDCSALLCGCFRCEGPFTFLWGVHRSTHPPTALHPSCTMRLRRHRRLVLSSTRRVMIYRCPAARTTPSRALLPRTRNLVFEIETLDDPVEDLSRGARPVHDVVGAVVVLVPVEHRLLGGNLARPALPLLLKKKTKGRTSKQARFVDVGIKKNKKKQEKNDNNSSNNNHHDHNDIGGRSR